MFSRYVTHVNGNRTRNPPVAPNLQLGRVNPIYSFIHIYLVDSPRIELDSADLQSAAMTTLAHCPIKKPDAVLRQHRVLFTLLVQNGYVSPERDK